MHLGIFAERFVGRYGADRVCVILAELLRQRGHRVTLVGVHFSRAVVERFAGHTLRLPDFAGRAPEPRTLQFLKDHAYYVRRHLPKFDACVVGSYPFITAIPYLRTLAPQVFFLDFGVVPTFGYAKNIVRTLDEVRRNRRQNLRHCTGIVAISDFIAAEQSRPDCEDRVPVTTALLGADHLVNRLGYTEADAPGRARSYTRMMLEAVRESGRKPVLVLGRWEPRCYKNSLAAFDVLERLRGVEPDAALLVMAAPHSFETPRELEPHVFCIGLPSDGDLLEVVRAIDAGISVSLWEGFNLPVAELQYQGKPAFALRLAAHPEIVLSPEQLCAGAEDMADRVAYALHAEGRPAWAEPGAAAAWRAKFTWRRFADDFCRVVECAA